MARLEGWSLSKDDWKTLIDMFENVEWGRTWLNKRYQDSVPQSAGIYLLVTAEDVVAHKYGLPKGISNVLYVGKSESLRDRFKQHAVDSQKLDSQRNPLIHASVKAFGNLRYMFAVVPDTFAGERDRWMQLAENALTTVFSPPANRAVPEGPTIKARLGPPQAIG